MFYDEHHKMILLTFTPIYDGMFDMESLLTMEGTRCDRPNGVWCMEINGVDKIPLNANELK